ncbi:MAG: radical SAM protein [Nanoarchaeota archaeon]|nr:radical SAM protein [Nanoarchaeota archaeon]
MKKSLSIIAKVTENCNLACKYCYAENDQKIKCIMDDETLEKTINKCYEFSGDHKNPHFIWHGGEPLLGGLKFFKKIVKLQDKLKPHKITNVVQSNGTLIDDKTLDFFLQNKIHVGASLDGPEEIHNKTRVYSNGKGSFKNVIKGIKKNEKRRYEHRSYCCFK